MKSRPWSEGIVFGMPKKVKICVKIFAIVVDSWFGTGVPKVYFVKSAWAVIMNLLPGSVIGSAPTTSIASGFQRGSFLYRLDFCEWFL